MLNFFIKLIYRPFLGDEANSLSLDIIRLYSQIESGTRVRPALIVQRVLVSAEDHRAANHPGYDIFSIARAIYRFCFNGRLEGGSTIVQQLVRVLTCNYEVSIRRKVKEIGLACLVAEITPREIFPSVYLSIAYYGTGAVGYPAICKLLRVPEFNCDLDAAAKIVARLKFPQPIKPTKKMNSKVANREAHISELYRRHEGRGVYEYLQAVFPVEPESSWNGATPRV